MKISLKKIYLLFAIVFLLYLSLPSPGYPEAIDSAKKSVEPADMESEQRRGYYTDKTREEVMEHYYAEFDRSPLFDIPLITYRLNYPPEEAQILIRDQTRSTFLEEIVHPFRESIFVNGFKPREDNEVIIVDGYEWLQKIIVKYIPSSLVSRLTTGIITMISGWLLIQEYRKELRSSSKLLIKIRRLIL